MPQAPPRAHQLTRAQTKVLAHIAMCRDSNDRLIESTRRTAEATGLTQYTVLRALAQLNDLRLIWTHPGSTNRPSEHVLLVQDPGRPELIRRAGAGQ